MNRNEYMKRVVPVISTLGEEKADIIMDKIAAYLVDAGEENEAAALNALGIPEIFARRFVHTDGNYEIPPFGGSKCEEKSEPAHERRGIFTHEEKMALKPKPSENEYVSKKRSSKRADLTGIDTKRMILLLLLLIITSPIWLCFMAIFTVLALVFAFAVTAMLLFMSIGGAVLTVLGVMRIFSVLPIGLIMTGAGLLLLGISLVAFFPLLNASVSLLCGTVKDIVIFVKNAIRNACEPRAEVGI